MMAMAAAGELMLHGAGRQTGATMGTRAEVQIGAESGDAVENDMTNAATAWIKTGAGSRVATAGMVGERRPPLPGADTAAAAAGVLTVAGAAAAGTPQRQRQTGKGGSSGTCRCIWMVHLPRAEWPSTG